MRSEFWPGVFKNSAVWLLGALMLLFLCTPFIEDLPGGDMIEASVMTMVMAFAVLAVGGHRRVMVVALLLAVPALGGKWASRLWPGASSYLVHLLTALVFFAFVVSNLIRFILRAPRVNANVLCAGLSGYLLLGLLWAPAYMMIARLNPAAFNITPKSPAGMDGFTAFYFSFMTLCTVGYGDVTPVSRAARMLAVVEAIVGLFYVAVLISRLVAIYSSRQPAAAADHDE